MLPADGHHLAARCGSLRDRRANLERADTLARIPAPPSHVPTSLVDQRRIHPCLAPLPPAGALCQHVAMVEWWPFDRSWVEEWQRNWIEILSMPSAAVTSADLPGDPFAVMMAAAHAWLVGKKRTLRFSGREVTLVLANISVDGTDLARAVGQYGQVRITAQEVRWDIHQLERVEIRARNVHLQPGASPILVAAPVLWEAFVSAPAASRWLATAVTRFKMALDAGPRGPQIRLAGMPWARLEVETGAEGRSIRIRPRALQLLTRRVPLRCPAFNLSLPALPRGVMLTSAEPAPGGFVVRGLLSEWQRSLSRDDIEGLLAGMRAGKERLDI